MSELRIPVLAAVPLHYDYDSRTLYASNGNGNGSNNGNGNHSESSPTEDVHYEAGAAGTVIEERG
jgi:hypothetical protein